MAQVRCDESCYRLIAMLDLINIYEILRLYRSIVKVLNIQKFGCYAVLIDNISFPRQHYCFLTKLDIGIAHL